MQRSYIDYAMSVIVGRALPDVRDGLKPVHTRVLYAMYDGGYRPDRGFSKCARVVGEVMGQYHPHGDSAIYDALVRLAQPWSMRMPLVDSQGNFGSPGNDPAAAMRYTECRLAPLAMEMLRDIDKETVDFRPNYDGRSAEPVVLPSRFPNLLVNGSEGIAVGMATKIPPHNLREVADGVQWYLDHFDASDDELLEALIERIKGPDFPGGPDGSTGAQIVGRRGIQEAYRTGRGSITMRAVVEVEEDRKGRASLVVTELPYQVNPDNLALKIAELARDGRVTGIADVRDETSGRTGQRLVIVLKRDAVAKVVLNNLYKHTQLQDTFGANMLALVDGVPRTLRLDQMIRHWVTHQIEVIVRRTRYLLRKAAGAGAHPARADQGDRPDRRGHRADPGQRVGRDRPAGPDGPAGDRRDPGPRDPGHAAAQARRPGAAAAHRRVRRADGGDRRLRGDPGLAGAAAADHRHRARPRSWRSTATTGAPRSSPTTATCPWPTSSPRRTWSSRSPAAATPSAPRPTCTGPSAAAARACAAPSCAPTTSSSTSSSPSTHNWILFFTNKGRVYRAKAYELPEAARDARGQHVANLLAFQPDERIAEVLALSDYTVAPYLVLATASGLVKKSHLTDFDSPRSGGIIAINLREDDEVIAARLVSADEDLLLVSKHAQAIRFRATDEALRPMGRATSGVIGMRFGEGDRLLGMHVVRTAPTCSSPPAAATPSAPRPTSTRCRAGAARAC